MRVETYTKGNASNCYLLTEGAGSIVIDPGCCIEEITQSVNSQSSNILTVLLTHVHYDHILQIDDYAGKGIPVYVHQLEAEWLQDSILNVSYIFGVKFESSAKPDKLVSGGQHLSIGSFEIDVLHTPGHTPGGVCYKIDNHLFSGDTLFRQSVGRYDLPGGNGAELMQSIKEKLYSLDDNTIVYPGHGPVTSIGYEKQSNPFVVG